MFSPGAVIQVDVVIKTRATGALVDPSTLTFTAKAPDGTLTTYVYPGAAQVVKSSTGTYYVQVTIPRSNTSSAVGDWVAEWYGTGSHVGVGSTRWTVAKSPVL